MRFIHYLHDYTISPKTWKRIFPIPIHAQHSLLILGANIKNSQNSIDLFMDHCHQRFPHVITLSQLEHHHPKTHRLDPYSSLLFQNQIIVHPSNTSTLARMMAYPQYKHIIVSQTPFPCPLLLKSPILHTISYLWLYAGHSTTCYSSSPLSQGKTFAAIWSNPTSCPHYHHYQTFDLENGRFMFQL